MSKSKSSAYAFSIATEDPGSEAKGMIAGREYYARKFKLGEVQAIAQRLDEMLTAKRESKEPWTVRDEMEAVVEFLGKRLVDDSEPLTAEELVDNLTAEEYREVLNFYAPSLIGGITAEQGKLPSSVR